MEISCPFKKISLLSAYLQVINGFKYLNPENYKTIPELKTGWRNS